MPQDLSAGPQRPTRPGPGGGTHKRGPRASAPASVCPRERPVQCGHVSQPGTAPPEPQQRRGQLVAAEPGPPRCQRHHERAGRLQQDSSTSPQTGYSARAEVPQTCPVRHAVFGSICVDPPPGGPAQPITLRDKLTCVSSGHGRTPGPSPSRSWTRTFSPFLGSADDLERRSGRVGGAGEPPVRGVHGRLGHRPAQLGDVGQGGVCVGHRDVDAPAVGLAGRQEA